MENSGSASGEVPRGLYHNVVPGLMEIAVRSGVSYFRSRDTFARLGFPSGISSGLAALVTFLGVAYVE